MLFLGTSSRNAASRITAWARGLEAVVIGGTALLWLATVGGFFGDFAWTLDLFSHFPVQYAALMGSCFTVLACLRNFLWAALALAGVLLNLFLAATVLVADRDTATAYGPQVRIVSLNVDLRNAGLANVARYLATTDADVIALQELTLEGAEFVARSLPQYPYRYLSGAASRYGAAVISRWPIIRATSNVLAPGGSEAAVVSLDTAGGPMTIVTAHLHWPLREQSVKLRNLELQGLAKLLRNVTAPVVAVGDFNVTAWSTHFRRLLRDSQMYDCAQGEGFVPTWPTGNPALRIRIDQCLRSTGIATVNLTTGPDVGSDHYPIINDLQLPIAATGYTPPPRATLRTM